MVKAAKTRPQITDPQFQKAVDLIDSGAAHDLQRHLDDFPNVLTDTADEDGSFAGDYFANPRLLWFVAENPIRNGKLPDNIAEVTQVIIDAFHENSVADLVDVANYTMSLVTSGLVARECNQQTAICQTLISAGADPNAGVVSALAHRETDACRLLLDCGARLTVGVAAGLGMEGELNRLKKTASAEQLQEALTLAAINGQHRCVRILADTGINLNNFNPDHLHAHSTPLHQAVYSGCVSTVCSLVSRGADPTIKDTFFNGDAWGWAKDAGHQHLIEFLDHAAIMMPAIKAVKEGRIDDLQNWLADHGDRVNDLLGDNPRTLLHYATDWPGFHPRAAETIATLVDAGANVNAKCILADQPATETPLHWAASSDDISAANALIAAGAELNPTGGCIGNGTPLTLAVIFQNWKVADALVDAGALISLPLVAGMGRLNLVESFFDSSGKFKNPHLSMPNADTVNAADGQMDGAMCLAAMSGRMEVIQFLLGNGANVNAISPIDSTPLDEALKNGHSDVADLLQCTGGVSFRDLMRPPSAN